MLQIFARDRGKSVLRIPLDRRRQQIEEISWVEQAVVRRSLPNRVEVEITERTPVAFLRDGNDLALLDAHGVILDRPIFGDFHFPVVTGIDAAMAQDDRELRMQLFSGFTQQIQAAHPGALDQVSEVDLSDEHDVRATVTGLPAMRIRSQQLRPRIPLRSSGNACWSASVGALRRRRFRRQVSDARRQYCTVARDRRTHPLRRSAIQPRGEMVDSRRGIAHQAALAPGKSVVLQ